MHPFAHSCIGRHRLVRTAIAVALFISVLAIVGCASKSARAPGVVVANAPVQTPLEAPGYQLHDDFLLERVAAFELEALVLSRKRYRMGREARLAPVDLALGWGPMSDAAVLDHISISQFRRYYFWKAKRLPIPRRDIERHSANMHMIPADDDVARRLKRVRPDDVVRISGHLVHASQDGRWRWRTSLSRDDTGNGACELVLVNAIEVIR